MDSYPEALIAAHHRESVNMFNCGYARGAFHHTYVSCGTSASLWKLKTTFEENFVACKENFVLDNKRFDAYTKTLNEKFCRWRKRSPAELDDYLKHFSVENWKKK